MSESEITPPFFVFYLLLREYSRCSPKKAKFAKPILFSNMKNPNSTWRLWISDDIKKEATGALSGAKNGWYFFQMFSSVLQISLMTKHLGQSICLIRVNSDN